MKANLIFTVIIFVAALLYIGHLQVSIKPFSVSFPYWHRSLGVLLMIIGVYVFSIGEHISAIRKDLMTVPIELLI